MFWKLDSTVNKSVHSEEKDFIVNSNQKIQKIHKINTSYGFFLPPNLTSIQNHFAQTENPQIYPNSTHELNISHHRLGFFQSEHTLPPVRLLGGWTNNIARNRCSHREVNGKCLSVQLHNARIQEPLRTSQREPTTVEAVGKFSLSLDEQIARGFA